MKRESGLVVGRLAGVLMSLVTFATATISCAHAQSFSVVKNFDGSNGGNPESGLTMGPAGTLFGIASTGGTSGVGVVFELTGNGAVNVLHSFAGGTDGATPNGGLIADANGALYGTTNAGGTAGLGTVFRVTGHKEAVLYSFAGGADGAAPQAGLVMDPAGNLYGTTYQGGSASQGTVFELVAPTQKNWQWAEKVLYTFGSRKHADGAQPIGGVTLDKAGNLYGTTSAGGRDGYGTVFRLAPGLVWTETILHSFHNTTDGTVPYAGLISDAAGNLYGAATDGGSNGGGTIFELKPEPTGNGWNFTVLASLPGWGISGTFRNLMMDASGNIYGTTHCDGSNNAGTIYELMPVGRKWKYVLLYTFTGGNDGLFSIGSLLLNNGALYGTTLNGGANGAGDIYRLTP